MKKLLNLQEVLEICRVKYPTLYRWRKSGTFPDSVGVGKLLWREDQIIEWTNRQSTVPSRPNVTTSAKERKGAEREFQERQEAAEKALVERHGFSRSTKGKQES